jgi:hypothetical protein
MQSRPTSADPEVSSARSSRENQLHLAHATACRTDRHPAGIAS